MEARYSHSLPDILNGKVTQQQITLQFNTLQDQFNTNPKYKQLLYSCTQQQKTLNRYAGVIPYAYNRVTTKQGGDYINASEMKLLSGYLMVAAQAPKPPFDVFWKVLVERDIEVVVMLCGTGAQADKYWPEKGQKIEWKDGILVEVVGEDKLSDEFYQRWLNVTDKNTGRSRVIRHFHWSGWEDFGVPSQKSLEIIKKIVDLVFFQFDNNKQVLIHCSAGIGRTGTMTTIIDMIGLLRDKNREEISIFGIVENLRKQRFESVEREVQYQFIYQYLKDYLIQNNF